MLCIIASLVLTPFVSLGYIHILTECTKLCVCFDPEEVAIYNSHVISGISGTHDIITYSASCDHMGEMCIITILSKYQLSMLHSCCTSSGFDPYGRVLLPPGMC